MEIFKKENLVLSGNVDDTKTSLVLRPTNLLPSSKTISFSVEIRTPPQAVLLVLINLSNHCNWKLDGAHKISWNSQDIELFKVNLPA